MYWGLVIWPVPFALEKSCHNPHLTVRLSSAIGRLESTKKKGLRRISASTPFGFLPLSTLIMLFASIEPLLGVAGSAPCNSEAPSLLASDLNSSPKTCLTTAI